jgi:iduronate 2-sulfatase
MDQATVTRALKTIAMAAAMARPFFIGVGIIRPHLPFVMPQSLWDMYNESDIKVTNNTAPPQGCPDIALNDQIFSHGSWPYYRPPAGQPTSFTDMSPYKPYPPAAQRFLRHGYYAAITWVDVQLGRLLDALDSMSIADSTVVAFHGDHGWHTGEAGLWTKKTNFELGTRVPLLIRAAAATGSAGLAVGGHSSELAELVDVYPTLAELAGLPLPPGE